MSISSFIRLSRWVISLAFFFLSLRMALFSLKIRLISLPRSFLNSSNATGLAGGELHQGSEKEKIQEETIGQLQVYLLHLSGLIVNVCKLHPMGPFQNLSALAASWYSRCADLRSSFSPWTAWSTLATYAGVTPSFRDVENPPP